jgi:hypothetical protein
MKVSSWGMRRMLHRTERTALAKVVLVDARVAEAMVAVHGCVQVQ